MYDSLELDILDPAECRRLLCQSSIGRFVFWDRINFAVHPVRYMCDGGVRILFRTESGAKVQAAARRQNRNVIMEVDQLDPISGQGWSVTLSGVASHVTDPYEVDRVLDALPRPWASAQGNEVICVSIDFVQGRRFHVADAQPCALPHGVF